MYTSGPLEVGSVVTLSITRDLEEETARRNAILQVGP